MKQGKVKLIAGLIILIVAVVLYQLLFGKLFPYSPAIFGFEKNIFPNTIIYTQKGADFDDFMAIDTLIPAIEEFHDLGYLKKPRIFIFSDSLTYLRHSPSKARFCVFYNARLFVTPWAIKEAAAGDISLETYLTHELSHTLLHQYSGFMHSAMYPKWLLEGIAVYSSNQMGTGFYPGKNETYQLIDSGNFMPPAYFKTRKEKRAKPESDYSITYLYSEFACIVDYLINSRGKERFLVYMKNLIRQSNHDKIFKQTYNTDFESFIAEFRQFVANNQPREASGL